MILDEHARESIRRACKQAAKDPKDMVLFMGCVPMPRWKADLFVARSKHLYYYEELEHA